MLQLNWVISVLKQLLYWLTGAGILLGLWKLFNEWMKSRAVKKSSIQSVKDTEKFENDVKDAEKSWTELGKENDSDKNSS